MKKLIVFAVLFSLATVALGQAPRGRGQGAAEQPAAPAADPTVVPQPKVNSPEEGQALMAIFQAPDVDSRIKAGQAMLAAYPNTEFKSTVQYLIAASYQEKNDFPNLVTFGEMALATDPGSYQTMLLLAGAYAQNTREKDLDMEEKLTKSDNYSKQAIEAIKNALRPRADVSPEDWNMAKRNLTAQAYETMGAAAMVRGKFDQAASHFKMALETAAFQEPTTRIRLASTYVELGRFDDAIALMDQVLADQQLDPEIRKIASQVRLGAANGKAQKQ